MKTAVIGCGNYLMDDDAVGLYIVRKLKKIKLPDNISIIEAGTPGLGLLDIMEGYEKAVIVDAVISGLPVGTIHRFTDKELPERGLLPLSMHGFNIIDAIELGKKVTPEKLPREIIIVGVEVEEKYEHNAELSQTIRSIISQLIETVLREIRV